LGRPCLRATLWKLFKKKKPKLPKEWLPDVPRGPAEGPYLPLEILIRSLARRTFPILGRPFGAIMAIVGPPRPRQTA